VLVLLLQGPLRERRAPARGITPRCESSRGAGPRVPSNFSMEVVATTFTAVKNGDVLLLKHLPVVPCGAFERLSIADPKSLPAAWGLQFAPCADAVCMYNTRNSLLLVLRVLRLDAKRDKTGAESSTPAWAELRDAAAITSRADVHNTCTRARVRGNPASHSLPSLVGVGRGS